MTLTDRNYTVANITFTAVEIAGWLFAIGGLIFAFMGFEAASQARGFMASADASLTVKMLAAAPGIGVTVIALFFIGITQAGRAAMDTARLTRSLLELAEADSARAKAAAAPRI